MVQNSITLDRTRVSEGVHTKCNKHWMHKQLSSVCHNTTKWGLISSVLYSTQSGSTEQQCPNHHQQWNTCLYHTLGPQSTEAWQVNSSPTSNVITTTAVVLLYHMPALLVLLNCYIAMRCKQKYHRCSVHVCACGKQPDLVTKVHNWYFIFSMVSAIYNYNPIELEFQSPITITLMAIHRVIIDPQLNTLSDSRNVMD